MNGLGSLFVASFITREIEQWLEHMFLSVYATNLDRQTNSIDKQVIYQLLISNETQNRKINKPYLARCSLSRVLALKMRTLEYWESGLVARSLKGIILMIGNL